MHATATTTAAAAATCANANAVAYSSSLTDASPSSYDSCQELDDLHFLDALADSFSHSVSQQQPIVATHNINNSDSNSNTSFLDASASSLTMDEFAKLNEMIGELVELTNNEADNNNNNSSSSNIDASICHDKSDDSYINNSNGRIENTDTYSTSVVSSPDCANTLYSNYDAGSFVSDAFSTIDDWLALAAVSSSSSETIGFEINIDHLESVLMRDPELFVWLLYFHRFNQKNQERKILYFSLFVVFAVKYCCCRCCFCCCNRLLEY